MKYKRFIVIVMDSLGIGNARDADKFYQNGVSDKGSNTFGHIVDRFPVINIPNLRKLGIGDLVPNLSNNNISHPNSYTLKLNEASNGKDTMTGHWEMMGIYTSKPFQTFTETGFPKDLIERLEKETGHKIIGNYAASGTQIIKDLGEQQIKENSLIVYTSADSVLQICGHEKYTGLDELYRCCEIARKICMEPKYFVGRVIARPYIGETKDTFKRTSNRRDYAVSPSNKTVMDVLKDSGYFVSCVGKISDIFNDCGVSKTIHTKSNNNGMDITIEDVKNSDYNGLCYVNLVEFDSEYGHRRNVEGYKNCIEDFDKKLGELLSVLKEDDILLLTADHGNDPTWTGSDHTREQVPLIIYSSKIKDGQFIGETDSFADIGASILKNFDLEKPKYMIGKPILKIF
ncbi:MAG: phosphopentomutase [Firmicutes bacterium]|nr:phosphopentomutase [Candidatus Alectryobacillus merdavium]